MGPATVSTMGRNITVIIRSASSADVKSIQLENQGHLFSVDNNVTLKLQNIVLKGMSANNRALVLVAQGGKIILDSGVKITANTTVSNTEGGGIYVNGGILEMNEGCEISGNTTNQMGNGGGIYVGNRGTVTIRGGLITSNKIANIVSNGGAGIFITGNSTVTMTGGIISKNAAWYGGGVYIWDSGSNFTKRAVSGNSESGIIYGSTGDNANIATYNGSAVFRGFGSKKNRNSTLGYYDEISTATDEGWE
jgi:hypothetical protein